MVVFTLKMSSTDSKSVLASKQNDAHRSIAKAEAEVKRIQADIAKILERQKEVTNNLSQLKSILVRYRALPVDTICHIFSILCTEKISIPHERHKIPPQIIVSHVCSEWREIALATPALWDDVEIEQPDSNRWVQIATELLLNRAGRQGVSLAIDMGTVDRHLDMGITFYDIVLPLNVKKLHLTLSLSALQSVSKNSNGIIDNIDEIALKINRYSSGPGQVSIAPQFLSKIRCLTCEQVSFVQHQNLPWAQIRYLNTLEISLPISTIYNILRQSPLLEVCKINILLNDEGDSSAGEPTALPQLRVFHIHHNRNHSRMDAFFLSFECPNLKDFSLEDQNWTPETYNIIRNHYNLYRLLKLKLTGYPYPISKVLHDAPMLQELIIARKILFMDASAIRGISSGKLGRCLTSLGFRGEFDVKQVFDMVASRQRCVKQIIEAGRNWQDQISGIKRIFVLDNQHGNYAQYFEEEVVELKKLGVDVYCPPPSV